MTTPNPYMFIVYVSDAGASASFYGDLLGISPDFESPRFIAFTLPGGVQFAVWSGSDLASDTLSPEATKVRTSELCLCLGSTDEIEEHYTDWRDRGVHIVAEPYDEVFGRTFLTAVPDGDLIRVAPID